MLGDGFSVANGVFEVGPLVVVLDGKEEGVVFGGAGMSGWFWRGGGQKEDTEKEKNPRLSHHLKGLKGKSYKVVAALARRKPNKLRL